MKKIVFLLLLVFLFGCVNDPERLVPPDDFKTGSANYLKIPVDSEKLANEGYKLDSGWNIFVWSSDRTYDNLDVEELFKSLEGIHYAYDYSDETFYFPTTGKYSKLREHSFYGERLFDTLRTEHKYGIYVIQSGVLTYKK